VLDELDLAGELKNPALRLLSEFLTEPSVSTFGAMVDAIPPRGRMFRQPKGRAKPDEGSSPARDNGQADADVWSRTLPRGQAEHVLEFIRQHDFRSAAVMLSRCVGYTHTEIARKFGISRSRSYRHEKWFEGLPSAHRTGIIVLGNAIRERHEAAAGADEPEPVTLGLLTRAIQSPESLGLLEGTCAK
jgi:hypothetical protein